MNVGNVSGVTEIVFEDNLVDPPDFQSRVKVLCERIDLETHGQ